MVYAITERQPTAQLLVDGYLYMIPRPRRAKDLMRNQPVIITSAKTPAPKCRRCLGSGCNGSMSAGAGAFVPCPDCDGDGISWPHDCLTLDVPYGYVVGSGIFVECGRIVDHWVSCGHPYLVVDGHNRLVWSHKSLDSVDVSDQMALADFTPGKWVWIFRDLRPVTERCPECWGNGGREWSLLCDPLQGRDCPRCSGLGRCEPWPVRGRPGVWEMELE